MQNGRLNLNSATISHTGNSAATQTTISVDSWCARWLSFWSPILRLIHGCACALCRGHATQISQTNPTTFNNVGFGTHSLHCFFWSQLFSGADIMDTSTFNVAQGSKLIIVRLLAVATSILIVSCSGPTITLWRHRHLHD